MCARTGEYVEVVRFGGELYGTGISAVRAAMGGGEDFCLVDVNDPASLRRLHACGIVPVSIFLDPVNEHVLKEQNPTMSAEERAAAMLFAQKV